MQQITLALDSDEIATAPPTIEPPREQRLIAVMAEAIIAVQHNHRDSHRGEKNHDPDRFER